MFSIRDPEHYDYPQLSIFSDKTDQACSKLNDLKWDKKNAIIYIHIPFCNTKCPFCNYYKINQFSEDLVSDYFSCLKKEIKKYISFIPQNSRKIKGIHFGGGTPSVIPVQYYDELLSEIKKYFYLEDDVISFEGNIKSLGNKNYMQDILSVGINRISFGIQSFSPQIRKKYALSPKDAIYNLIDIFEKYSFKNYHADIMYAFPEQTLEETIEDIEESFKLGVRSVDFYSLRLFPDTHLYDSMKKDSSISKYTNPEHLLKYKKLYSHLEKNDDIIFLMANTITKEKSYKNNILSFQLGENILNGGNILGIGASSRGYLNGLKYKNYVDINDYMTSIDQNSLGIELLKKLTSEEIEDRLMVLFPNFLNLPKNIPLSESHKKKLQSLIQGGLIYEDKDFYHITPSNAFWAGNISSYFYTPEQRKKMVEAIIMNKKRKLNMYNQDQMNMKNEVGDKKDE